MSVQRSQKNYQLLFATLPRAYQNVQQLLLLQGCRSTGCVVVWLATNDARKINDNEMKDSQEQTISNYWRRNECLAIRFPHCRCQCCKFCLVNSIRGICCLWYFLYLDICWSAILWCMMHPSAFCEICAYTSKSGPSDSYHPKFPRRSKNALRQQSRLNIIQRGHPLRQFHNLNIRWLSPRYVSCFDSGGTF